jgi:hypothetical protein
MTVSFDTNKALGVASAALALLFTRNQSKVTLIPSLLQQ